MGQRGLILRGTIALAGEVLVNPGGEPERDDSGLPPVDIVVPDDARELDRDVQAYRRELRALRRHERRMRLHGPLTRDGVILPLLASCLVLALIAGTLLTVFTAAPGGLDNSGVPAAPAGSAPPGRPDTARAVPSPARIPAGASITISGAAVPLQDMSRSVLALIPPACHCSAALAELVGQSKAAGVPVYVVGGSGGLATTAQAQALAQPNVVVADDTTGVLARTFLAHGTAPAGAAGPIALLVAGDGQVSVTAPLPRGFTLTRRLRSLATSHG
jgi:hypothetical protein